MVETDADAFARAAEDLAGTPFRLHGRDPASGLDCIGLVHSCLLAIGRKPVAPRGYRLRNLSIAQWIDHAEKSKLQPAEGCVMRGDVLLVQPSAVQHHLLIALGPAEVVHAHAGLRKVVRQPLSRDLTIGAHWRLAPSV